MTRQPAVGALLASAGLLVSAHAAHAQFDTFSGDIQLGGVPVVSLGFDFMGPLAISSLDVPLGTPGNTAEIDVSRDAIITHTGDLMLGSGANTYTVFDIGTGASWTTTGAVDMSSGINSTAYLEIDDDVSLSFGGHATMASGAQSIAGLRTSSGSSATFGGDLSAATALGSIAEFSIYESGVTLDVAGSFDLSSADQSQGYVELEDGAQATIGGSFTLGQGNGSNSGLYMSFGTEFHVGGHMAMGHSDTNSELYFSMISSRLTSASLSIDGVMDGGNDVSYFEMNTGSSIETGALTMTGRTNLQMSGGSTLIAGDVRIEGDSTDVVAQDASSLQLGSLKIADRATVEITSGSSLDIAGDLTFEPATNNPRATVLTISNASSTLSIGGTIVGNAKVIDFNAGHLEIGGGFTIKNTLDAGLRNYNSNRTLTVGGLLTAEIGVSIGNGGTVRAGSMTAASVNRFNSGAGSLIVDTILLDNAGQTTTELPTFTTPVNFSFDAVQNDGLLGPAFINNNTTVGIVNSAIGEIRMGEGDDVTPAWIENRGRIELLGRNVLGGLATIDSPGTILNHTGGVIFAQESEIRTTGGINNQGTIGYTFGRSSVFGGVTNTGLITITGDSAVTFFGDVSNNGTIHLALGGSLTGAATVFGTYSGAGDVSGGGDLFLLGDVQIGNSPADVLFDTSLFLGATTDTTIELAGTGPGEFDRVSITGDFDIAGDLGIAFLDGFLLEEGMVFDIFNVGGTRTGGFNGLQEGDLVGTFNSVDLFITYDHDGLGNVALFSVPAPGALAVMTIGLAGLARRRRL